MIETTIIYRATMDHLRTMILFDHPVRQRIERAGKIDGFAILAIAHQYGVLRNLKVQSKGLEVWDQLAEQINALSEACSAVSDTTQKAGICVKMRSRIVDLAGSECWSAISKWLWFAAPDGWLPCDKWVRAAHGDFSDSITKKRFEDFYDKTQQYIDLFRGSMKSVDLGCGAGSLYPERVLDKALMIAGARARSTFDQARHDKDLARKAADQEAAAAAGRRKKKVTAKPFICADERWWEECSAFLKDHPDAHRFHRIAASVANLIDDSELPKVAA